MKSERMRSANKYRRDRGQWAGTGATPFGYEKTGEPKHYSLIPKEPEATLVREAAADVLVGKSLASIARKWNTVCPNPNPQSDGLWRARGVKYVLCNPVSAGLVVPPRCDAPDRTVIREVIAKGDWEPIFDEDTHRALVTTLYKPARKSTRFSHERKYIGSGVYECGTCGAKMWGRTGGRGVPLYVCLGYVEHDPSLGRAGHASRKMAPLDELVCKYVLRYLNRTDIRDRLKNGDGPDRGVLLGQRDALVKAQGELGAARAAGEISMNAFKAADASYTAQIDTLDRVLAEAKVSTPAAELVKDDPDDDELLKRWNAAPPDIKGKVIGQLMVVRVNKTGMGKRFDPSKIDIRERAET